MRHFPTSLCILILAASWTHAGFAQGLDQASRVQSPLRSVAPGADGIRELALDFEQLAKAERILAREGRIELTGLPLPDGRAVDLSMRPIDPFDADTRIEVMTAEGIQQLPAPDLMILAGEVIDEPGSDVFLSFTEAGIGGWINSGGVAYSISDGRDGGAPMISRFDLYPPPEQQFCGAENIKQPHAPRLPQRGGDAPSGGVAGEDPPPCLRVSLAIETDQELRDLFGGTDEGALGYVATMVAAASHVYTRDVNTRLVIGYLRLWATEDPWTQPSMGDQLYEFRDYWEVQMDDIDRDLAHFLSGRGLGGGVAWVGVVCNPDWGYALSANLGSNFPYPIENNHANNWDLMVFMHELGHNFGAPHTHSLDPPYDECANGDCSITPNATIMSYCHGCPGGLANIRLEFCPPNIVIMNDHLANTGCDLTVTEETQCLDETIEIDRNSTVIIDALQNDVGTSCMLASLVSWDDTSAEGGQVFGIADWGPDGREVFEYVAPTDFVGFDSFNYVSQVDGVISSCTVLLDIEAEPPLRPADDPLDTEPGIEVAYYALEQLSELPDFSTLVPFDSEIVADIDYEPTGGAFMGSGLNDDVGAVFTGWVEIPEPGEWRFGTGSDDGSALYIGEQRVVNNDGLHSMLERSGTIHLDAGVHAIRVEFFERGGDAGLFVKAGGPGTTYDIIPASRWSHGGVLPPDADLDGDGLVNGSDLTILLSAWGTDGIGDLTEDGIVDGEDLTILLAQWTTG